MPGPTELRIFISSTFRDLQEEREHLVKRIFPEIRALCRERGITFTEVDLRWGLTHDEGTYGRIIRTCLEEVDRCRPYFIGITGNRYGYIPGYLDIQKDPQLLRLHPWVEDAVLGEMSITAMEINYGVLDDPAATNGARFYFRRERASLGMAPSEAPGGDDELQRLEHLKERIRAGGLSVQEFRDPVSLGEMVYDDLIEIIRRDFADAKPPTPLEEERSKHVAFSTSRRHAYIANPLYLKRLNEWHLGEEPPLIIYAESGSGKSSLVAFWCEQLRRRQSELFVVEHYVGIGVGDTDHLSLIRYVMQEINERFARDEELPSTPTEIESGFGQWLGYASHELKKRGERMVLVLDGLNQLEGAALQLLWIPDAIPPEIRLIVTSTVEGTLVGLRRRGWQQMGMQPLHQAEREAVVVRYLSEYHKELPVGVVERIAGDPKCAHPLFLRTLLEELRLFGQHERVEQYVERLLDCTGTEDLFQLVLERLEEDYNLRVVREVMSLLWGSRTGLSEAELTELTGISRLKLSTLLLGLDYHLLRRDGLLGFFHDYLRRAVQKRYLPDGAQEIQLHRRLAEYFQTQGASLRISRELIWQFRRAGDRKGLADTLSDIRHFKVLYKGENESEVLSGWAELGEEFDIVDLYQQGLERWRRETVNYAEECDVLGKLTELLEVVNKLDDAIIWQRNRLGLAIEHEDRAQEAKARSRLGFQLFLAHRQDEAMQELTAARALCEELGDRGELGYIIGNMGHLHSGIGEYERSIECHLQQEELCRSVGDQRGVGNAIQNIGNLLFYRQRYEDALECVLRAESAYVSVGDQRGLCGAFVLAGNIYISQGEMDHGIKCLQKAEVICRSIGFRLMLPYTIANQGVAHVYRGEYDGALECFQQTAAIFQDSNDQYGHAWMLWETGLIHAHFDRHNEALDHLTRSVNIDRTGGQGIDLYEHLLELAQILVSIAETHTNDSMPEYVSQYLSETTTGSLRTRALLHAREYLEECLRIVATMEIEEVLFQGAVLHRRIDASEGRVQEAVAALESMLAETADDTQRAHLHYWLWRFASDALSEGGGESRARHGAEALRLFTSVLEKTPRPVYRKRIEELTKSSERITRREDDAIAG